MPAIHAVCCSCEAYGPVSMIATIGPGRQVALCSACSATPARLRAFVARFNSACDATDPVLEVNRYLANLAAAQPPRDTGHHAH